MYVFLKRVNVYSFHQILKDIYDLKKENEELLL